MDIPAIKNMSGDAVAKFAAVSPSDIGITSKQQSSSASVHLLPLAGPFLTASKSQLRAATLSHEDEAVPLRHAIDVADLPFPLTPASTGTPSSQPYNVMNYAFSDGAASSDTEASPGCCHSSDTEPEIGPFTPLTPSYPLTCQAGINTVMTGSAGGILSARCSGPDPPPRSPTLTSCTIGKGSEGTNPWRPRELHLVDRRKRENSANSALAGINAAADSIRYHEFPLHLKHGVTSSSVGLGIQLPKSPALGQDCAGNSGASVRSNAVFFRANDLRSEGAFATGSTRRIAGIKGLKTLTLTSGSRLDSAGGRSSPIAGFADRSLVEAVTGSGQNSASCFQYLDLSRSRSREASRESPLLNVSSFSRLQRSPLQVLPRTPIFTDGAPTSWARKREEMAISTTSKLQFSNSRTETSGLTQTSQTTNYFIDKRVSSPKKQKISLTRARSVSPVTHGAWGILAVSDKPVAEAQSRCRSRASFSASALLRSRRRKAPPTPLILFSNSHTPSMAPSGGQGSAFLVETTETDNSRYVAQGLRVISAHTGSPLSPFVSEYNQSFPKSKFSPPTIGQKLSAAVTPSDQQNESHRAAASSVTPTEEVRAEGSPSSRISLPLKSAYFDIDGDGLEHSSPSNYDDNSSEASPVKASNSSEQSNRTLRNSELSTVAATEQMNVPLILRHTRSEAKKRSILFQKHASNLAMLDYTSWRSGEVGTISASSSCSNALSTIPSASSLAGNERKTSSFGLQTSKFDTEPQSASKSSGDLRGITVLPLDDAVAAAEHQVTSPNCDDETRLDGRMMLTHKLSDTQLAGDASESPVSASVSGISPRALETSFGTHDAFEFDNLAPGNPAPQALVSRGSAESTLASVQGVFRHGPQETNVATTNEQRRFATFLDDTTAATTFVDADGSADCEYQVADEGSVDLHSDSADMDAFVFATPPERSETHGNLTDALASTSLEDADAIPSKVALNAREAGSSVISEDVERPATVAQSAAPAQETCKTVSFDKISLETPSVSPIPGAKHHASDATKLETRHGVRRESPGSSKLSLFDIDSPTSGYHAPLLASSLSRSPSRAGNVSISTSTSSILGEIVQFPSVPSSTFNLPLEGASLQAPLSSNQRPTEIVAASQLEQKPSRSDARRSRGNINPISHDVESRNSAAPYLAMTPPVPEFNTSIFRGLPSLRSVEFDEGIVDPMDLNSSKSSDRPLPDFLTPCNALKMRNEGVASPQWQSQLQKQLLPTRSSTLPTPPSVEQSVKPKLWLQTAEAATQAFQAYWMQLRSPTAFSALAGSSNESPSYAPLQDRPSHLTAARSSLCNQVQPPVQPTRSAPLPQVLCEPASSHCMQFSPFDQLGAQGAQNGGLSSRFSSGSESEGDAFLTKRNSKGRRSLSSKKRASSATPSAQTSLLNVNSVMPSPVLPVSLTLPKSKGFFQSLGMKKKSLPNIQSLREIYGNGQGSLATPNSDSPALTKIDTGSGFPFPGMMTASAGRINRSLDHDDVSQENEERQASGGEAGHKPQATADVPRRKRQSVYQEPISGHRTSLSVSEHGVLSYASLISRKERRGIAVMDRRMSSQTQLKRQSQMSLHDKKNINGVSEKTNTGSKEARNANALASTRRESTKLDLAEPEKTLQSRFSSGLTGISITRSIVRQSKQGQQRPEAVRLATQNHQHIMQTLSGTRSTPRSSIVNLAPTTVGPLRSEETAELSIGEAKSKKLDALSAIDEDFVNSLLSPTLEVDQDDPIKEAGRRLFGVTSVVGASKANRKPALVRKLPRRLAKRRKAARLAQQSHKPHYPSLTDEGCQWILDHLYQELTITQATHYDSANRLPGSSSAGQYGSYSDQHQQVNGSSNGNDDADCGNSDSFGSSGDGRFGSGAGSGGDRRPNKKKDDSDDDASRYGYAEEDQSDEDVETSESEDDYGKEELVLQELISDDSDDQPLGQQIDNVKLLQRRLQAQERRERLQDTARLLENGPPRFKPDIRADVKPISRPARRDVPQAPVDQAQGQGLKVNILTDRLQRLQMRRQQQQPQPQQPLSRAAGSLAASEAQVEAQTTPSRLLSNNILRSHTTAQSTAERTAQAEKIYRARSLANGAKSCLRSDSADDGQSSLNTVRARRSSDAASRGLPTFNMPPISLMPSADSARSPASLAGTNAAVTQAAMVVATQAAREGRIPESAILLQAEALAVQAMTASGSSPMTASPLERASSRAAPSKPMTSQGDPASAVDSLLVSTELGKIPSSSSADCLRRRPTPLEIRSGYPTHIQGSARSPPLRSPLKRSSDEHSSCRRDEPLSSVVTLSRTGTHKSTRSTQSGAALPAMPVRLQMHRVYIVTRQRYLHCELPTLARARDVVLDIIDRETIQSIPGRGGWALFDVSPTYGIERPLREYEVISHTLEARSDVTNDYFLLKQTELAPYASIRAIPNSSPALAGWTYVRDRRGKWSKRWLELREHSLFHAKSEKGKDEVFICHLSVFDVYLAEGPIVKAPKAHTFAVRSQNPLTMFENKEDFVHYFCLSDPSAHRDWIRAIMNARTYVLRQENLALFTTFGPPSSRASTASGHRQLPAGGGTDEATQPSAGATSLSRRETGKRPSVGGGGGQASESNDEQQRLSPLISRDAFASPFEKGSLLANEFQKDFQGTAGTEVGRPIDLSMHERIRARRQEEKRRAEFADRQRRAKQQGKPLINVASGWPKW